MIYGLRQEKPPDLVITFASYSQDLASKYEIVDRKLRQFLDTEIEIAT